MNLRLIWTMSLFLTLIMIGCGGGNGNNSLNDENSLPVTLEANKWYHTTTRLTDGTLLIAGGNGQGVGRLDSAYIYDPSTNQWTSTDNMSEPRSGHAATLLFDGRVIVTGGLSQDVLTSSEIYDPTTRTWSLTSNLREARTIHTAILLNDGRVMVAGGIGNYAGSGKGSETSTIELFDPNTNTWTLGSEMSYRRSGHTVTLLPDGRVLAVGGFDSGSKLVSVEIYDPATDTWSPSSRLTKARMNHAAILLANGNVLVTGGIGATAYKDSSSGSPSGEGVILETNENVIFDPTTGAWSPTGDLLQPRSRHIMVSFPDGKILIIGGRGKGGELPMTEIYEPSTGTWSTSGELIQSRKDHTATQLSDDKVIVIGGFSKGKASSLLETYDHSSGTWKSAPANTP